ncbi:BPSS1187 family protein [Roseateles sp. P5_E4]
MRRLLLGAALLLALSAQAEERSLRVAPQAADARLKADESPHWVVYDPAVTEPLLVWLPGTNGHPASGPKGLFQAVRSAGFRLVGLSYLDDVAVSQVCKGPRLQAHPTCAAAFRQQRVWGDATAAPIDDRPEDAIVPRLTRLLRHLAEQDPAGQWVGYLDGDEPRWSRIVLAGQSQGGGMAAFIAKTRSVAGVLDFSGGWDREASGDLARWYRRASVTPPERWHATYHVQETAADLLAQSYRLLGIPPAQVHALDLPLRPGGQPHGEGIANAAYAPLWQQMLRAVRPEP